MHVCRHMYTLMPIKAILHSGASCPGFEPEVAKWGPSPPFRFPPTPSSFLIKLRCRWQALQHISSSPTCIRGAKAASKLTKSVHVGWEGGSQPFSQCAQNICMGSADVMWTPRQGHSLQEQQLVTTGTPCSAYGDGKCWWPAYWSLLLVARGL